ncbi:TPA: condensation domain-containing protein [Legionella anisa]
MPEPMFTSAEENYVPPRTPLEEQLCGIWQDVFKIEKIGIRDNFFQLGGDSILSIRIVSVMKQLGFNISVRDIFQHNTIEHIVPIISKQKNIKENASYQPFSLISSDKLKQRNDADMARLEDMYPVCYLQAGMLLEGELTDDGSYHDVFCYTIQKPFNKKLFLSVWDQLITKHAMLRTSFAVDSDNGYIALQYKNGSSDKCFVLEDTRSIEAILSDEKLEKFNYSEPGLFRFLIAHQESTQFNLIFSFHHVIGDGWSIASLISEFVDLYVHDDSIKVESILPFYGEFVAQEKAGIKNQEIQQFWYNYLNDYQYVKRDLRLNKEAESLHDVHTTTDILSKERSAQLIALAHELSISVDILLLSAYQFLLSTFFNNDDLIIGLVVNNRLEKTSGDQLFGSNCTSFNSRYEHPGKSST